MSSEVLIDISPLNRIFKPCIRRKDFAKMFQVVFGCFKYEWATNLPGVLNELCAILLSTTVPCIRM